MDWIEELMIDARYGDAAAMYDLSKEYIKLRDKVLAYEWLQKSAELDYAFAQEKLGSFELAKGNTDRAIYWWRRAMLHEGSTNWCRFNVGVLLAKKGDFEEAIDLWRPSADLGHDDATCNIAQALKKLGRNDESRKVRDSLDHLEHPPTKHRMHGLLK